MKILRLRCIVCLLGCLVKTKLKTRLIAAPDPPWPRSAIPAQADTAAQSGKFGPHGSHASQWWRDYNFAHHQAGRRECLFDRLKLKQDQRRMRHYKHNGSGFSFSVTHGLKGPNSPLGWWSRLIAYGLSISVVTTTDGVPLSVGSTLLIL